jgi:hypothetical protein
VSRRGTDLPHVVVVLPDGLMAVPVRNTVDAGGPTEWLALVRRYTVTKPWGAVICRPEAPALRARPKPVEADGEEQVGGD